MEAADKEKWKGITEEDDKWRLPIGIKGITEEDDKWRLPIRRSRKG